MQAGSIYKINLSVFYAEVRFIFAFGAKIRVFGD